MVYDKLAVVKLSLRTLTSKFSGFWVALVLISIRGFVINHLKTTLKKEQDTTVIYYFFDHSVKESLRISTFLRCILHQVIRPEKLLPSILSRLESLFPDQMNHIMPDVTELEEIFLEFYRDFKIGLLLIDGLDEADVSSQENVRSFLREVQKISSVRVLTFTHPEIDMLKVLKSVRILQIKPEDLKIDIQTFVDIKIDNHAHEELSVCPPALLDTVKQTLLSLADGM